jgi:hypothetical protein
VAKQQDAADITAGSGEIGRCGRGHTTLTVIVIGLCGLMVAGLFATLAALAVAAVHGAPLEILTVSGGTFGTCLTLEIALAALYAGLRR